MDTSSPLPRTGRRQAGLPALLAVLALLATTALLLAACGSGDDDSASADTTTTTAASSGSSGRGGSGAVEFAHCSREYGVDDFPDPGGKGTFTLGGDIQSNPNFQTAVQACQHLLPNGLGGGGSGGGNSDTILAFAQCMRANGVPD